jgi:hypothetical protein
MNGGRCVRCGRGPRADETFLCERCLDDPESARERLEAELLADVRQVDARRVVVERFKWYGGWPRARA